MGYGNYLNWSRRKFWLPFIPFLGAILLALPAFAAQKNLDQGQVRALIAELVAEHGFDSQALTETFSEVDRVERVVKAMARPAEKAKPWYEYRKHFISAARINSGVKFWQTHQAALTAAEAQYGVAPEVIVGIIGVETSYGAFTGKDRVLDALATLAFHYPESRSNKVARMKFFRSQLKDLMLLAREQSIDPLSLTGSYAGAMGIPWRMVLP
ncbi:MAG: lytic murein transglycosylase [Pseudomonadota bacterium]